MIIYWYKNYYKSHAEYYSQYHKIYANDNPDQFKIYRRTYYIKNRARIIENNKTRYRNYTINNQVVVPNPVVDPKTCPKEIIVYFK